MALSKGAKKFGLVLIVAAALTGIGYKVAPMMHKKVTTPPPAVEQTLQVPASGPFDQDAQNAAAAARKNGIPAEVVQEVTPAPEVKHEAPKPAKKHHTATPVVKHAPAKHQTSTKSTPHHSSTTPTHTHQGPSEEEKALESLAHGSL